MSRTFASLAGSAVLFGLVGTTIETLCQTTSGSGELRTVASFAGITDPQARSVALFEEAGKVLQHPRCVNCHPAGDRPHQRDDMRPHLPPVVRGKDGRGAPGMACATCHGPANFDPARVPGNPRWQLAPLSMAWEGKSLADICNQLKDPNRNGGRNVAAILKHVTTDSLVRWGWEPGASRMPAPGTNEQFTELLKAWADAGAYCPPS